MFYPDEIIEEIQQRADITEVISSYLPLKKAGNLFKALCPFHQEKTPSFVVNPQKQIFHCFGCGVGGNVFTFLIKQENISFPEAVEILARQTGVDISRLKTKGFDREDSNITTKLYEINELVSSYYQNNLLNKENGKLARQYLKERKIDSEVISKFCVGYASIRNSLLEYLQKRGYQKEILLKGGLSIKRESGDYIDKFINKIIFPLFNPQGKIVGFGSRRLDNQTPKYIHSPQTILFNKSKYLYGLNFARQFIKKDVIIVEGYLDLFALVQFGIRNVVASLGTALTYEQIRLLKRYTEKCIIIYDGDKAGQEACLRGLELFMEEEMPVGVVELPSGLDPDDCIRKEGKQKFEERIEKNTDFFDYKLKLLSRKYNLKKTENSVKIAREMLFSFCKIGDVLVREVYIKRLSQSLEMREESLYSEIEKIISSNRRRQKKEEDNFNALGISSERREEKILLGLMLTEEKIISLVGKNMKADEFRDFSIQKVVKFLLSQDGRISVDRLIEKLREEKIENLDSLVSLSVNQLEVQVDFAKKMKVASDCIKRIKDRKREEKLLELSQQIKGAEGKNDEDLVSQLVEEYQRLLNTDYANF
ncbi:MAG: DNA primase [Candidatus Omnitrophica bacterium]|nr:DNA primase [Candidatus Omnitrophota bacterium]